jgi:hypothetical protein
MPGSARTICTDSRVKKLEPSLVAPERGFAGAGRAHEGDEATRRDRQAHVLERMDQIHSAAIEPGDVSIIDRPFAARRAVGKAMCEKARAADPAALHRGAERRANL